MIEVVKTNERVPIIAPALVTRFRGRAERRARKENEQRLVPFYRWEVIREGERWVVIAFQNRAVPR